MNKPKHYEKRVEEQEARTFWGKPTRHTTIDCWHHKLTYEEFVDYTRRWGLQDNLQGGEKFVEDWMELFCCYHEIEQQRCDSETKMRNRSIDDAVEAELRWEEYQKNANV